MLFIILTFERIHGSQRHHLRIEDSPAAIASSMRWIAAQRTNAFTFIVDATLRPHHTISVRLEHSVTHPPNAHEGAASGYLHASVQGVRLCLHRSFRELHCDGHTGLNAIVRYSRPSDALRGVTWHGLSFGLTSALLYNLSSCLNWASADIPSSP